MVDFDLMIDYIIDGTARQAIILWEIDACVFKRCTTIGSDKGNMVRTI